MHLNFSVRHIMQLNKIGVALLLSFSSLSFSLQAAETATAKPASDAIQHHSHLSQQEYQVLLNQYTQVVNDSKRVLDDPASQATASEQKQAFCARYQAYKNIADISERNLDLYPASVMLMVANRYLEQQHNSLTASGMTEQVFCAEAK